MFDVGFTFQMRNTEGDMVLTQTDITDMAVRDTETDTQGLRQCCFQKNEEPVRVRHLLRNSEKYN